MTFRHPHANRIAVLVRGPFDMTAEANGLSHLRVSELPRVPHGQPLVRDLDLPVVDERLAEDSVLVANPVANRRDAHGGQRIDVAGGQSTETTVAESRLRLRGRQVFKVEAQRGEPLANRLLKVLRDEGIDQLRTKEVLSR